MTDDPAAKAHAERLVRLIKAYWEARGKHPTVTVVREDVELRLLMKLGSTRSGGVYGIRSNIVNGWAP